MKKALALIVALMMIAGAACASGIDWGSMTDQQITMAIAEAEAELDNRAAGGESQAEPVKEVTVPMGVWVVGEDIPVGHWTIKVAPGQEMEWGTVAYGVQLDELGKDIEYVYDKPYYREMIKLEGSDALPNLTEVDLDVQEGAYIVIDECDMIFTPYQGKPKLGF